MHQVGRMVMLQPGHRRARPIYTAYKYEHVCFNRNEETSVQSAGGCPPSLANICGPGEELFQLLGLHEGQWESLGNRCRGANGVTAPAQPQVTPGMVAQAFQRIPLPTYRSLAQPAGKTLVNFDTIFHTQATPLDRQVTLLGQRVSLHITPSSYRWEFGDGSVETTSTPGAAYPAKTITHRYPHAHVTVRHRVQITWSATFTVNGNASRPVPGTVTTTGPVTNLRIAEATPALAAP